MFDLDSHPAQREAARCAREESLVPESLSYMQHCEAFLTGQGLTGFI